MLYWRVPPPLDRPARGGLVAALLLLAGCGPPLAAAIVAVTAGATRDGGGGGGAAPRAPVAALESTPTREGLEDPDRVLLVFRLSSDGGGSVDVDVRYALDPGEGGELRFVTATPAGDPRGEGVRGLSAPSAGAIHTFVWDAARDLEGRAARVRLEVTPCAGGLCGPAVRTPPFVAGNTPPRAEFLPTPADLSGNIVFRFRLRDDDGGGDLASIEALAVLPDGTAFPAAVASGRTTSLPADGEPVDFVWASLEDPAAGGVGATRVDGVRLRIVPADRFERGEPADSAPFSVRNNSLPVADLVDGELLADRTNEVPIAVSIRDANGHEVDAIVQYARGNEGFPSLPPDVARRDVRQALLADPSARARFRIATVSPDRRERRVSGVSEPPSGSAFAVLLDDAAAPVAGAPPGAAVVFTGAGFAGASRLAGVDPATGRLALDPPLALAPPAGAPFVVAGAADPLALATSPEGVLHRVVWDSLADLGPVDVPVRVRVTPIDSEIGLSDTTLPFAVANGPYVEGGPLGDLTFSGVLPEAVVGDVTGDDLPDIVVRDETPVGGFGLSRITVQVGDGRGSFATGQVLTGLGDRIALADANGDGRLDLFVLRLADATLSVHLQGGGALATSPATTTTLSGDPSVIGRATFVVADLAGSGGKEAALVITEGDGTTRAVVYALDAAGNLPALPSATLDLPPVPIVGFIAGDIDPGPGDELIVRGPSSIAILDLDSTRTALGEVSLSPAETLEALTPTPLAVADFDGDGVADLAEVGRPLDGGRTQVRLYRRAPGGLLEPGPAIDVGADFVEAAIATRADDDSRADLALLPFRGLSILHGRADGAFRPGTEVPIGLGAFQLAAGELDAVAGEDLVVMGPELRLFFRDRGLRPRVPVEGAGLFAIADFDGDGRNDLAVAAAGQPARVHLYLQDAAGRLSAAPGSPFAVPFVGPGPGGEPPTIDEVAAGDANGDGRVDLIARLRTAVAIFPATAGGALDLPITRVAPPGLTVHGLALADVSGDGRSDLVVAAEPTVLEPPVASPGFLLVFAGLPGGVAAAPDLVLLPAHASPIARGPVGAGDVNGDGLPDLVVHEAESLAVLLQQAHLPAGTAPRLAPPVTLPMLSGGSLFGTAASLLVADLSGDGADEIVATADLSTPAIGSFVFRGVRGGVPTPHPQSPLVGSSIALRHALVRAEGEDRRGLATLGIVPGSLQLALDVFPVAVDGTFGGPRSVPLSTPIGFGFGLGAGDLSGDGVPDLAVGTRDGIAVLFARGGAGGLRVHGRSDPALPAGTVLLVRALGAPGDAPILAAEVAADGLFSFRIPAADLPGAFLVETGMRDGRPRAALAPTARERADGVVEVALGPLSTFAADLAAGLGAEAAVNGGAAAAVLFGGGFDPARLAPASTPEARLADSDAAYEALLVAALDALAGAQSPGATAADLLAAAAADLLDGRLDGTATGGLSLTAAALADALEAARAALLGPGSARFADRIAAVRAGGGLLPLPASVVPGSVDPPDGPCAGGVPVGLEGEGLDRVVAIAFGAAVTTDIAVAADGRSLTAITPPGAPGTVDLVLRTSAGLATRATAAYTFFAGRNDVEVSPPRVDLPEIPDLPGRSERATVSIRNAAGALDALEVTLALAGAGFALEGAAAGASIVVPAGAERTFDVVFTPPGVGTFSGRLSIASNDADETLVLVPLVASVRAPRARLAFDLPFPFIDAGEARPGEEREVTVGVRSEGDIALSIARLDFIEVSGGAPEPGPLPAPEIFPRDPPTPAAPLAIEPGAQASVTLVFRPRRAGELSFLSSIDSNDPAPGDPLFVRATGVGPRLELSLSEVGFGLLRPSDASPPAVVRIANRGTPGILLSEPGSAEVTAVALVDPGGAFAPVALETPVPFELLPGEGRDVRLAFAATAPGIHAATLRVETTDPTFATGTVGGGAARDVPVSGGRTLDDDLYEAGGARDEVDDATARTVEVHVFDRRTGEPLDGATVLVGASRGTTGADGVAGTASFPGVVGPVTVTVAGPEGGLRTFVESLATRFLVAVDPGGGGPAGALAIEVPGGFDPPGGVVAHSIAVRTPLFFPAAEVAPGSFLDPPGTALLGATALDLDPIALQRLNFNLDGTAPAEPFVRGVRASPLGPLVPGGRSTAWVADLPDPHSTARISGTFVPPPGLVGPSPVPAVARAVLVPPGPAPLGTGLLVGVGAGDPAGSSYYIDVLDPVAAALRGLGPEAISPASLRLELDLAIAVGSGSGISPGLAAAFLSVPPGPAPIVPPGSFVLPDGLDLIAPAGGTVATVATATPEVRIGLGAPFTTGAGGLLRVTIRSVDFITGNVSPASWTLWLDPGNGLERSFTLPGLPPDLAPSGLVPGTIYVLEVEASAMPGPFSASDFRLGDVYRDRTARTSRLRLIALVPSP